MLGKIEIYKDKKDEWRWKFIKNGRIMADSSEGYATEFGVKRAIVSLKMSFPFSSVKVTNESK